MTEPKTLAHPKTLHEWYSMILEALGGAEWNVELTEEKLNYAIWQTLALYNKYKPHRRWRPLGEVFGDAQFDLSDEAEGTRVVDVRFKRADIRYSRPLYLSGNYGFYHMSEPRKIYKMMVADDRYNSFLGMQPVWQWHEETRTLFLHADSPLSSMSVSALLLVPWCVTAIPYDQEYDFLEGAVGHAKMILGRMFRKFGAIPAAQGSVTLDATSLVSEGQAAVANLIAKLERNLKHLPPRPIYS